MPTNKPKTILHIPSYQQQIEEAKKAARDFHVFTPADIYESIKLPSYTQDIIEVCVAIGLILLATSIAVYLFS